LWSLYSKA
jgi:glutamyl-tRNA reductase